MGVDQISQFRPNFTISAKFHNPGILGIPEVRAVSQFLRCFFFSKIRLLRYSIKYLVVFFNQTSYILNLNLHHILQLQHCLENLNSKVTNLSISLHARKQSTLIQGSPINSGAQGANWTQESSRPSLPPLKGSMHPQILIIFFSFSKQGLTRRPPPHPPTQFWKLSGVFLSRRIPLKNLP